MAAAEKNPWDLTPARVPTLVDLGSPNFKNVTGDKAPLDDGTMPEATMFQRLFEAAVSAGVVAPSMRVTVRFSAGAPVIDSFLSPRSEIGIADIEAVDNGTGDTTVRVRADRVPTKRSNPALDIHEGTGPTGTVADYSATDGGVDYRGARVKTWVSGTLTNLGFSVTIY